MHWHNLLGLLITILNPQSLAYSIKVLVNGHPARLSWGCQTSWTFAFHKHMRQTNACSNAHLLRTTLRQHKKATHTHSIASSLIQCTLCRAGRHDQAHCLLLPLHKCCVCNTAMPLAGTQ